MHLALLFVTPLPHTIAGNDDDDTDDDDDDDDDYDDSDDEDIEDEDGDDDDDGTKKKWIGQWAAEIDVSVEKIKKWLKRGDKNGNMCDYANHGFNPISKEGKNLFNALLRQQVMRFDTSPTGRPGSQQHEALAAAYRGFCRSILGGLLFHPFYKENYTRSTFQSDLLEKVRRKKDFRKRRGPVPAKHKDTKGAAGRPSKHLNKKARKQK